MARDPSSLLACFLVAILLAGCTSPGGAEGLFHGAACSASSQCAGGNCRFGVCCAIGERCCSPRASCPSDQDCGPAHHCVPTPTPAADLVVQEGDGVVVDYVGWTTDDRVVFTASTEEEARRGGIPPREQYAPLRLVVGSGEAGVPGFERGLVGMRINETRELVIPPDEAFGPRDPALVQPIPADVLRAQGFEPREGEMVLTPGGAFPIVNVSDGMAWVDMNALLAGRTVAYRVTIRDIARPG